jgi:hypothetical protein
VRKTSGLISFMARLKTNEIVSSMA